MKKYLMKRWNGSTYTEETVGLEELPLDPDKEKTLVDKIESAVSWHIPLTEREAIAQLALDKALEVVEKWRKNSDRHDWHTLEGDFSQAFLGTGKDA